MSLTSPEIEHCMYIYLCGSVIADSWVQMKKAAIYFFGLRVQTFIALDNKLLCFFSLLYMQQ